MPSNFTTTEVDPSAITGAKLEQEEVSPEMLEIVRRAGDTGIHKIAAQVRTIVKNGVDRTVHAQLIKELVEASGLKAKELNIPWVDAEAREAVEARREKFESGDDADLIDSKNGPDTAQRFLNSTSDHSGVAEFVRFNGDFYAWRENRWAAVADEEVIARIYDWYKGKREVDTDKAIKPDRALVEATLHAVKAVALVTWSIPPPFWFGDSRGRPPAEDQITFSNYTLDLGTRRVRRPQRVLFQNHARDFPLDLDAPKPAEFLSFLASVLDADSIETSQEIAGYLLSSDTAQQKVFLIVGPPRSGKGLFLTVLKRLLGLANVCAPTLQGLGGQFGMQGLIGKLAVLISDARLSSKVDVGTITETMLRVSGEDTVSVPRKFKDDWVGRLTARFVIASNEVPALLDQSGALASRFIIIRTTTSYLGREDRGLEARLLNELPSIALWALEGLDRLRERGYFRQPASAFELVRQLENLSSPIKAFLSECCEVVPGASVGCSTLFASWNMWAAQQGREHGGTAAIFGRNLAAALPAIKVVQPRVGGGRERRYEGIRLRADDPSSIAMNDMEIDS